MDEAFELPVHYKGEELLLPAQLQACGYIYPILVTLKNQVVILSPMKKKSPGSAVRSTESA
jgi:hypothetical protein